MVGGWNMGSELLVWGGLYLGLEHISEGGGGTLLWGGRVLFWGWDALFGVEVFFYWGGGLLLGGERHIFGGGAP